MAVTAIHRNFHPSPQTVNMFVTDTLSLVAAAGYLTSKPTLDSIHEINYGAFTWLDTDIVEVFASDGMGIYSLNSTLDTLVLYQPGGSSGGVTPQQVQQQVFIKGENTGTADALVVTLDPPITNYADVPLYIVSNAYTNTTSTPTIDINGLGTVSIFNNVFNPGQLLPGEMPPLCIFEFDHAINAMRLVNPTSAAMIPLRTPLNYYSYGEDIGDPNNVTADVNCIFPTSPTTENYIFYIKVNNTNTGDSSLQINGADGNALTGLIQVNGLALVANQLLPDNIYIFIYNSTGGFFDLINPSPVSSDRQYPTQYIGVRNGTTSTSSGTTVTCRFPICRSADDSFNIPQVNATCDLSTNGANGLDTGSIAADTGYYLFSIADSTGANPIATLASTSTNPSLPGGYDVYRAQFIVVTDSVGDLYTCVITPNGLGSFTQNYQGISLLTGGNETSAAEVIGSVENIGLSFINPVTKITFAYTFTAANAGNSFVIYDVNSNPYPITAQVASVPLQGTVTIYNSLLSQINVQYLVTEATDSLDINLVAMETSLLV